MGKSVLENMLFCYDNGGKTCDRYTIIRKGDYEAAGMSEHPNHPQGFCQYIGTCKPGRHLGKRIPFNTLPVACQRMAHWYFDVK